MQITRPRTVSRATRRTRRGRSFTRASGIFAAALAAMFAVASCVPPLQQQKNDVDRLLSQDALTFASQAGNANFRAQHPGIDFTTDGCSNWFLPDHLNDTGATFDFTAACWHHDFGYRNYKRFNEAGILPNPQAARVMIDQMFLGDMKDDCALRPTWMKPTCLSRAELYYGLARQYGKI